MIESGHSLLGDTSPAVRPAPPVIRIANEDDALDKLIHGRAYTITVVAPLFRQIFDDCTVADAWREYDQENGYVYAVIILTNGDRIVWAPRMEHVEAVEVER